MSETKSGDTGARLCSMNHCPAPAVHWETGETTHWLLALGYCDEHFRELANGTPVGPVGIDSCRVQVTPKGIAAPDPGGRWAAPA